MIKAKLLELGVILLLFGSSVFGLMMLYTDTEKQLREKDRLIDSLQTENLNSTILYTKKIDSIATLDTNYSYHQNGNVVSIASIIRSANQWYSEKEKLKVLNEDLISKYKKQSKSYMETVDQANSIIKQQRSTIDRFDPYKYQELDAFKKLITKIYGISYTTSKSSDSSFTLSITGKEKIDTALSIYNQMKNDKNFKIQKRRKN